MPQILSEVLKIMRGSDPGSLDIPQHTMQHLNFHLHKKTTGKMERTAQWSTFCHVCPPLKVLLHFSHFCIPGLLYSSMHNDYYPDLNFLILFLFFCVKFYIYTLNHLSEQCHKGYGSILPGSATELKCSNLQSWATTMIPYPPGWLNGYP